MENMDKGLTVCTKMGADKSFENTPNAPKVWDFDEKRLHWASVVRVHRYQVSSNISFSVQFTGP